MDETQALLPAERIEFAILVLRGERVLLDADIAVLYDVETRILVQAVKRNPDRFPPDFMFQLTREEVKLLKGQLDASKGRGGRRYLPYAFTEQGVAMLSSVLGSERAVRVNIEIMRAFVRLRRVIATHADLVRRLDELEQRYDDQFKVVFDALRQLMAPLDRRDGRRIGFSDV